MPSLTRQGAIRVDRPPVPATIARTIESSTCRSAVANVAAPFRPHGCNSTITSSASQSVSYTHLRAHETSAHL
eukprot:12530221-Alexandrium_andersonii.AAC.1